MPAAKQAKNSVLRALPWCFYLLSLVTVGLSRLFIATHFPHQVLLGLICGTVLGSWLIKCNRRLSYAGVAFHAGTVFLFIAGAFAFYFAILLTGKDPSTSVGLALQHCAKRTWVHLDTTPFYSLFRSAGSIFGLGIVSAISHSDSHADWCIPRERRLAAGLISFLAAQLLLRAPLPTITNHVVVYVIAFIRYATLPCVSHFSCRLLMQ